MWTSGGAILRDLSRAQGTGGRGAHTELWAPGAGGRGAHAELRALRPRDRPPPPPHWLSEETKEYVRGLVPADGGACATGPDLRHIQQMLDMMRKLNIAEEGIDNDEALIDELDSYAIEHSSSTNLCRVELAGPTRTPPAVPAAAPGGPAPAPDPAPGAVHVLPLETKKRRRNIALESIIEALENNHRNDGNNCTSDQLTLLKPEDLITKFQENLNINMGGTDHKNVEGTTSDDNIDSNEKVNHWINRMLSPIQTNSQSKQVVREAMRLDPSSMFKKKVKVDVAKPCTKVNREAVLNNGSSPGNGSASASYIPSGDDASICYQRYKENNKLIQIRREEASQLAALITEALERAAHAQAECAALEESPCVSRAVGAAPAGVRLAAPRRCLPRAPCLVCARLTRQQPDSAPASTDAP